MGPVQQTTTGLPVKFSPQEQTQGDAWRNGLILLNCTSTACNSPPLLPGKQRTAQPLQADAERNEDGRQSIKGTLNTWKRKGGRGKQALSLSWRPTSLSRQKKSLTS